jgi:osmotically-inducible protein OsmY
VQKVSQMLVNHGFRPPCRLSVSARNGDVTLTGTLQYENQRRNAVRTAQAVPGVRRVIDQMKVQQHQIWGDRFKPPPGQTRPTLPPRET